MNSIFARHRAFLIIFALAIIVSYFMIKDWNFILSSLMHGIDALEDLVNVHYYYALGIFFLIFVAAMVLMLPVSGVLTIAAGYLFGPIQGAFYSISGLLVGSTLLFIIVHNFVGFWVQKRFRKRLGILNEEINQYGPYYLIALRLMPGTPTFFINILIGLTKVSLPLFVITTLIGVMPRLMLYSFLGYQLNSIKSAKDVLAFWPILFIFLLLALLVFSPVLLKRQLNKMKKDASINDRI